MLARLLHQPVPLGAVTGDRQRRTRMAAPDPGERREQILHALLVFEPTGEQQLGRTARPSAFGERPRTDVDAVVDHRDVGGVVAEQSVHLVAHRRRTRDESVGFGHQPPLDRMHLPVRPTAHPAAVPPGLRRVDRGNQWHIEELGQRDGRVGDQPIMRVHDLRHPSRPARSAPGAAVQNPKSRPHERMPHGQRPGHHVLPELELRRVLGDGQDPDTLDDGVRRRMSHRIGPRRTPGQHDHVVPGGGHLGGEVMDMPAESAHHHRRVLPRHEQHLHRIPPSTPTRSAVRAVCSRRASSAGKRLSARAQAAASVSAASSRPRIAASLISRVACACV